MELKFLGYEQSKNDYSLFVKQEGDLISIEALYVDDIVLTGNDQNSIDVLKKHLNRVSSRKYLGQLHYFLGMEVTHTSSGIVLSQKKFAKELLSSRGMEFTMFSVTPWPLNIKLTTEEGDLLTDPTIYRSLVGKLNFFCHTRPDLAFTVRSLSQIMQRPWTSHLQALKHTFSYIAGTVAQGILLKGSCSLILQAFSDSDWGSCPISRRSITGYLLLFGQSPVSWKSKKQSTVSQFSSEAEYRLMASVL